MEVNVTGQNATSVEADLLVIPVGCDLQSSELAAVAEATGVDLAALAFEEQFKGAVASTFICRGLSGIRARRIALVGVGDASEDAGQAHRRAGVAAARLARDVRARRVAVAAAATDPAMKTRFVPLAAAEDHDLLDGVGGKHVDRMVGAVGRAQLLLLLLHEPVAAAGLLNANVGLLLLVGLYVRARVAESPVFDQAMKRLDPSAERRACDRHAVAREHSLEPVQRQVVRDEGLQRRMAVDGVAFDLRRQPLTMFDREAHAELAELLGRMRLDLEPDAIARLRLPDRGHRGAGITGDHA